MNSTRQIALDNICLRPCERWAHTEYSLGYHTAYLEQRTGVAASDPAFWRKVNERFVLDFGWSTNDGLHGNWESRGRCTDMGHAVYAADGSDRHDPKPSPFRSADEVWAFDAVAEYGLPSFDAQVAEYERQAQEGRAGWPDVLSTGGYYKTIVSGAIQAFGWEMFLTAFAEPAKMERVLDSFFRRTLFHMQAWAKTSVEAVIQHDDFVWTEGAFVHPDIYRRVIIPRYAELWKPLRQAGKKVMFCSDGNFTEFAADIVAAGAEALIFEPCNDFEWMAERFGDSVCLVGSCVDCRDLTLRHREQVLSDIERTFRALKRCKGAILSVGNHMPPNIPADMNDLYFDHLLPRLGERS